MVSLSGEARADGILLGFPHLGAVAEPLGEQNLCNTGVGELGSSGEAGQGYGRSHLCVCTNL